MNVDLFRELTEAHGCPGQEDLVREIVKRELAPFCDLKTDFMGNLIAKKGGSGGPKLMLAAHMDEIGFRVKHVSDKGFLRVAPVGGWDTRQMASQRVMVHTEK